MGAFFMREGSLIRLLLGQKTPTKTARPWHAGHVHCGQAEPNFRQKKDLPR